eukprot:sb/3473517/
MKIAPHPKRLLPPPPPLPSCLAVVYYITEVEETDRHGGLRVWAYTQTGSWLEWFQFRIFPEYLEEEHPWYYYPELNDRIQFCYVKKSATMRYVRSKIERVDFGACPVRRCGRFILEGEECGCPNTNNKPFSGKNISMRQNDFAETDPDLF